MFHSPRGLGPKIFVSASPKSLWGPKQSSYTDHRTRKKENLKIDFLDLICPKIWHDNLHMAIPLSSKYRLTYTHITSHHYGMWCACWSNSAPSHNFNQGTLVTRSSVLRDASPFHLSHVEVPSLTWTFPAGTGWNGKLVDSDKKSNKWHIVTSHMLRVILHAMHSRHCMACHSVILHIPGHILHPCRYDHY